MRHILSISLPTYEMSDILAWNLTRYGTFSLKSAYYAVWKDQHGAKVPRCSIAGAMTINLIWETMWSMACLSKVKIFIWRTLQGTLPCCAALADTYMKVNTKCPACEGVESVKQILFQCQKAKQIWSGWARGMLLSMPALLILRRSSVRISPIYPYK